MLKVIVSPPSLGSIRFYGQVWLVSVKTGVNNKFGQLGTITAFVARPTQRQIRQVRKLAKAAFQEYANAKQGGAA